MFHEGYGEMTAEDVKFTVEQSFKPDAIGGSAYFFRNHLDRIETPDKLHGGHALQEPAVDRAVALLPVRRLPERPSPRSTWRRWASRRRPLHPIGTGPYRHVEGKQGDYHRFEAVPNHWRKTPAFKELVIRRIAEPATRMSGLRSGEIDITQVFGDFLEQAQKAGLRIHENPNAAQYWVHPDGPDHARPRGLLPAVPLGGRARQRQEPRERAARSGRP